MARIRPLMGQLLIEELPNETITASGLALPDTHTLEHGEKMEARKGKVLAVGPWKKLKCGLALLPEVKVGEIVLYSAYTGQQLTQDVRDRMRLVKGEDLLAVLDERR